MRGTWGAVVTYPPSWIAMAAVVVAVAATLLLLEPSPFFTAVTIVVGILAVVAWPITLTATGTLDALRYRAPTLANVSETEIRMLGDQLERLDDRRAFEQLKAIRRSRDTIITLLDRRRKVGEMIYERYRSTTQQIFLVVVNNLQTVLRDADGERPTRDDSAEPDGIGRGTGGTLEAEMVPLTAEDPPASTGAGQVSTLLAENDSAIAVMDRASTALGNAAIGLSSTEATAGMQALQDWVDRAVRGAHA